MIGSLQGVLFDFDYTLADSSRGVIACANGALGEMGFPAASPEAVRRTIGLTLGEAFTRLTGSDDAGRRREFRRVFKQYADEVMAEMTELFATVAPAMLALKQRGLKLGIVSTKFRFRIEAVLRRDGLLDVFDVIIGAEDVTCHKPDPEGLRKALEHLGIAPANALYVGDSVVDAETALRAGTAFAAVLSGVTGWEEFADFPAWAVVEDLAHLTAYLEQSAICVETG